MERSNINAHVGGFLLSQYAAQAQTGSLRGRVTDQEDAVVQGAEVVVSPGRDK
jgi:hypothetical protein